MGKVDATKVAEVESPCTPHADTSVMRFTSQTHRRRAGTTLLELLLVLGILSLMIGMLLPALQKVRESANRIACANNLKSLALAVHSSVAGVGGRLPYNVMEYPSGEPPPDGDPYWSWVQQKDLMNWSWLARLLPFVEQDNLYRECGVRHNSFGQSRDCLATPVKVFFCPSDRAKRDKASMDRADLEGLPIGLTNYKGVSGTNWCGHWGGGNPWHNAGPAGNCDGLDHGNGMFYRSDFKRKLKASKGGSSYIKMISEDQPHKNWWCSWAYANGASGTLAIPPNVRKDDGSEYSPDEWWNVRGFRSAHPGGLHVVYLGGHVEFISDSVSPELWRASGHTDGERVHVPPI